MVAVYSETGAAMCENGAFSLDFSRDIAWKLNPAEDTRGIGKEVGWGKGAHLLLERGGGVEVVNACGQGGGGVWYVVCVFGECASGVCGGGGPWWYVVYVVTACVVVGVGGHVELV